MGWVKGFLMSLGMFSILPVRKDSWDEKYKSLVIPSMPLVGLIIGVIWYGLTVILREISAPPLILCAVSLFLPFILSGFIHTDGYMDTADAVLSRRDLDEKKRILKDPNVGAFAVLAVIVLIISQFCAVQTILGEYKTLVAFIFIPVVSRSIAGMALLGMKPLFDTGFSAIFRSGTGPRHSAFILLTLIIVLSLARLLPGNIVLPLVVEIIASALTAFYLYRQFHGISGDLCGCVITVGEFAALICMALLK